MQTDSTFLSRQWAQAAAKEWEIKSEKGTENAKKYPSENHRNGKLFI